MKKFTLILIIYSHLLSCNERKEKNYPFEGANTVEYYKVIEGREYYRDDQKLFDVIYSSDCKTQNFEIEKTIVPNFHKTKLKSGLGSKMKEYFILPENKYQKASFSMVLCAPVYRDILVFKNDNTIIGIAKVCFSCSQNFIITKNGCAENIDLDYASLNQVLANVASR